MYHNYYFIPINSVRMIEGTVHTLFEDRDHHITGVSYKDKDSGEMKVSKIDKYSVLTPLKIGYTDNCLCLIPVGIITTLLP